MNQENQQKDYWLSLIVDYLTGSISESSRIELEDWVSVSDDNRKYFEEMKEVWAASGLVNDDPKFDSDKAYQLFKKRTRVVKRYTLRQFIPYAVAAVTLVFLSYFAYSYYSIYDQGNNFVSRIIIPHGSKSQIELSDGTKVWLNAGSHLEIDNNFGKKERKVKLYGEATFDVVKNSKCPFFVETDAIDIKVTGTTFNVNTYKENKETRIALLNGSVELLLGKGNSAVMNPNDLAVINQTTRKVSIYEGGIKDALAWRENRLLFNGERFEDIVSVLERNFNVKINIHRETIKEQRFAGDFVNDEKIEQVLNIMASNKKFTYKIKGKVIDIY